jgi:hypothetical protein
LRKLIMEASSNGKLQRDQMMQIVQLLRQLAQNINDLKFTRKINEEITDAEFKELSSKERKLSNLADELVLKIFDSIITDIQAPATQIKITIEKVNAALVHLENVNKILQVASQVINLFTTVTLAVATGNIAQVGTIIQQIDGLLNA